MRVSPLRRRRPSRVSTVFESTPSFVDHQKRSRPSRRCGSGFCGEPIARCTSRLAPLLRDLKAGVAAADYEHAAPGDIRRPAYPVLCAWNTSAARPAARAGTFGAWNGPMATTTWSARIRFSPASSTNAWRSLLSERTRLQSAIGSWKCAAYRSRYATTSSRVGYPSGSPGKASPGSAS